MKKSLRLLTLIFFSFALPVFFCAPIFCDTWSWTGGDSENNWAYGPPWRNETTGEEGTILTGHPDGADDIAYISGDCEIELKGPLAEYDITLNELRFQTYTGAAYKTSSWTATVKGSKTLTFNLMELDRAATLAGVTGTLVFNCPTVCKGKIITHSDTTFTATKPITLAADSEITAIGNGAITISELAGAKTATLFCGTDGYIAISAYDTTDVPSIVVAANSKSVSLGGGTIAGLTVNSNAAATVTSGMTVDGDLVVDGELTIAGDLTVTGTLTVTGSGKLTVNGDLDVTGATKNEGTITTNAGALTVTGDISNAGTLATNAALTFASDFTNTGTFTPAAGTTVTATGASASFTGNGASLPNFVYAPASTSGTGLAITDTNTITNFSCSAANAKIAVNAANSFGTFSATGAGASITLSGANTIGTLTMTSGGGSLTVNAAQTITGNLTLKGTGTGANVLAVTGTGSLNIASNQSAGEYLSVAHAGPAIGGGSFFSWIARQNLFGLARQAQIGQ